MIILHRYRLIFLKTRKTAGTSIEHFLAQLAEGGDIVTPVYPPLPGHVARNDRGLFNPFSDSRLKGPPLTRARTLISITRRRQRYFNHMTAADLMRRIPPTTWRGYRKISVERNPWDKVISMYNMLRHDEGRDVTLDAVIDGLLPLNWPVYADPRTGTVLADRVLRYERLQDELAEVFGELGVPFSGDLGVSAKSGAGSRHAPLRLSLDQAERIEARFASEIGFMGYSRTDARVAIGDGPQEAV